jgi:hypothetical protein
MSLVTEILDRLSGVAIVRERLSDTGQRVDRLSERVLDHERRLARLETLVLEAPVRRARKPER